MERAGVLDAAGVSTVETHYGRTIDVHNQSLLNPSTRPTLPIISEAYAPQFALTAMQNHKPGLIQALACDRTRWSILEETYKLIRIQGVRDELYHRNNDPAEEHALKLNGSHPSPDSVAEEHAQGLRLQLSAFLEVARQHSPDDEVTQKADLENELVQERLRGLGYIE